MRRKVEHFQIISWAKLTKMPDVPAEMTSGKVKQEIQELAAKVKLMKQEGKINAV